MSSPEAEAAAHMKRGHEKSTKSVTRWTVKWDDAADEYEKAAKIYTHLGDLGSAREAWMKAGHAHEKAKNDYFSARCYENLAGMISTTLSAAARASTTSSRTNALFTAKAGAAAPRKLTSDEQEGLQQELCDLYSRTARLYALQGKFDKQAEMLVRAAKAMTENDSSPEKVRIATQMLLDAIDSLEENDQCYHTPDIYRQAVLMQLRAPGTSGSPTSSSAASAVPPPPENLMEAIKILKKQSNTFRKLNQPANGAKSGLEVVILCLAINDLVLARREFDAIHGSGDGSSGIFGFVGSKEEGAAGELLSAFEDRDPKFLEDALKNPTLQFIIPEISRMCKRLKLDGRVAPQPKDPNTVVGVAVGVPPAEGGAAPPPPPVDDEEDLR